MTTIVGVKTNIPLHLSILSNTDFIRGDYNTQFLEKFLQKNGEPK
jgi:acetyl-CoA carboxylase biotin carboxylase subunit